MRSRSEHSHTDTKNNKITKQWTYCLCFALILPSSHFVCGGQPCCVLLRRRRMKYKWQANWYRRAGNGRPAGTMFHSAISVPLSLSVSSYLSAGRLGFSARISVPIELHVPMHGDFAVYAAVGAKSNTRKTKTLGLSVQSLVWRRNNNTRESYFLAIAIHKTVNFNWLRDQGQKGFYILYIFISIVCNQSPIKSKRFAYSASLSSGRAHREMRESLRKLFWFSLRVRNNVSRRERFSYTHMK